MRQSVLADIFKIFFRQCNLGTYAMIRFAKNPVSIDERYLTMCVRSIHHPASRDVNFLFL